MIDRNEALAIESIELEARRDNYAAAPRDIAESLGIETSFEGGVGLFSASRVDSLFFNRAFGVGLETPAGEATLDRVQRFYEERGVRSYAISLCPLAAPADLEARLAARSLGSYFRLVKWIRDAAPAAAVRTELRTTRIEAADAARFGEVFEEAFRGSDASSIWAAAIVGRRGWSQWLAREGETPVACAAMYASGGIAWLGWGGTLPSHRGRGAQSALIAARIEAARAIGCRLITAETGPTSIEKPNSSYRNVERAGFRVAYLRPSWVWPNPG